MYSNKSKYEAVYAENSDDGTVSFNSISYNVFLKGFNLMTMRPTRGWEKVATVKTEEEAKQMCKDILPSQDDD